MCFSDEENKGFWRKMQAIARKKQEVSRTEHGTYDAEQKPPRTDSQHHRRK